MKFNIPQTRSIVFICVLAFGILQHAAWAADERQTLQALSKSFTVLAQEVGEVVVGIETERLVKDKDWEPRFEHFERRDVFPFVPEEFHRWFRPNSNRDEKSEDHFFFSPDPYEENRKSNVLSKDILPHETGYGVNFGSGILLDEYGHIATVADIGR